VTKLLAEQRVNIVGCTLHTGKDRLTRIRMTIEASDPKHLQHVMAQLRKATGVYDVYRVQL
jgi:GTP pyrophosphokinase